MAQQVTALINFKHCDFGEDFAKATAAYDSDPQTAWIAPFTIAQRAYWAQQGGGLINGYAEAYTVGRSNSISNAAQSAYAVCMAGGASAFLAPVVEPSFKLVVQTKLDGGSSSGGITPVSAGPSAQLSVPFSPAATEQDQVLDWKAFYRLGSIQLGYNYATNWVMSYPSGGGYTLPSYTTLPMIPSINVDAENLVSISADLVQYIDVPAGMSATTPDNLIADFTAVQSFFSFTLQRRVVLPDGQVIQEEFEYDNGSNNGILSDVQATVELPGLEASCNVSGTVDVYHFITAYAFGTLYKLLDKMQQVRVDGVDYDFTVPANAMGSVPPSYGPPGLKSLHESFYYTPDILGHLFIDCSFDWLSFTVSRAVFRLVNYLPTDIGVVVRLSSPQSGTTVPWAWVRLPAATSVGGDILPTTKYYSWVVRGLFTGAFSVQVTAPSAPVTTLGYLAEKEVTMTGNIKTYSISNQYEYPGTSGFTPMAKSCGGLNYGQHDFPPLPDGYFTVDDPDALSNYISPLIPGTFLIGIFRSSGTLSDGSSWANSNYYIYNSSPYYPVMQGNVFVGILDELQITDHLLIDITDIYSHSGKLWVDTFYSPTGVVIDEDRMRNVFNTRCSMAVAVPPYDPHVPFFTSISIGDQVRFGTYLNPFKLNPSNLADVGAIAPTDVGNNPDNRMKYYF